MRIDLDHRPRVLCDPAHVVGRHPRQRIDKMLLDVEDFVFFLVEAQMREGEMRGVDRAFQRLHPVAVLPFLGDVAVRGRQQRHLQRRQFRHGVGRAHIGPDHVAPFAHRIGLDADQVFGVEIGIGGRHVDASARRCRTSSRDRRSGCRIPHCGRARDWRRGADNTGRSRRPRRGCRGRRAAPRPCTTIFFGGPSASGSSSDSRTGKPEPAQQLAHSRPRTAFG